MARWKQLALMFAVGGWFCFRGIGAVSFIDPDEGMYGTIAREMSETGDWVTPRFNGTRYLNKPPLVFWLSALTFKAFGPSEWGVRLWSALPLFGTTLLIALLGSWLYGEAGGFFSALIFSSSLGVFMYAHATLTDPLLVFSISLAMTAAAQSVRRAHAKHPPGEPPSNRQAAAPLLFYPALALGVLTKGLIAVLLPAAIIVTFALLTRRPAKAIFDSLVANRYAATGLLLFFLAAAPWHVFAARNNPGFSRYYLLDDQLLRYVKDGVLIEDDVSITTPLFLLLSLVWLLPWSLFLPAAAAQVFKLETRPDRNGELRLLPAVWASVVLLFFSFSSSKLEHYSLPALPALSLMIGGWWVDRLRFSRALSRRARYGAFASLAFALLGIALFHWSGSLSATDLFTFSTIMGYYRTIQAQGYGFPLDVNSLAGIVARAALTLLLGTSVTTLLLTHGRVRAGFFSLMITAAGIFILLFRLILLIEPYHSTKNVSAALLARTGPRDFIVHEDPLEYSGGLPYYTGRKIYLVNGKRGSLEFGSRYPEARQTFLDSETFATLWNAEHRVFLVTRLPREHSVVRLLANDKVFLVGQFGARWLYSNRE